MRWLIHEGRQITTKARHVNSGFVPHPDRLWEVEGKECGVRAELQDGSPKVTDVTFIQLDADLEEVAK